MNVKPLYLLFKSCERFENTVTLRMIRFSRFWTYISKVQLMLFKRNDNWLTFWITVNKSIANIVRSARTTGSVVRARAFSIWTANCSQCTGIDTFHIDASFIVWTIRIDGTFWLTTSLRISEEVCETGAYCSIVQYLTGSIQTARIGLAGILRCDNMRRASNQWIPDETFSTAANWMMHFDMTFGVYSTAAHTGILTSIANASLGFVTVHVLGAFRSIATCMTQGIASCSRCAFAGRFVFNWHGADCVWSTGTGLTGTYSWWIAAEVGIAVKSISTVAVFLIGSNVAVGIRSARTRLAQGSDNYFCENVGEINYLTKFLVWILDRISKFQGLGNRNWIEKQVLNVPVQLL